MLHEFPSAQISHDLSVAIFAETGSKFCLQKGNQSLKLVLRPLICSFG